MVAAPGVVADDSNDNKGSATGVLKLGLELRRQVGGMGLELELGYSQPCTRMAAAMLVLALALATCPSRSSCEGSGVVL